MEIAEWNSWFGKAKKNSVLVESYISLEAKDLNNNIKASNSLNETIDFIPVWQKVNLLKSFIEHLCPIDDFLYKRCNTLWKYFDNASNSFDLKKFLHYQRLVKFTSTISQAIISKLSTECKGKLFIF